MRQVGEVVPSGVAASTVLAGDCFVKRQGQMVYLRLSPGSLRYLKEEIRRNPAWDMDVIGVSLENGNVCAVEPDTFVVPVRAHYKVGEA